MSQNLCRFIFSWFSPVEPFLSHFVENATKFRESAIMSKKLGCGRIFRPGWCLSGSPRELCRGVDAGGASGGCLVWQWPGRGDRSNRAMSGAKIPFWPGSAFAWSSGGVRICLCCSVKPDFHPKSIGFRVAALREQLRAVRQGLRCFY